MLMRFAPLALLALLLVGCAVQPAGQPPVSGSVEAMPVEIAPATTPVDQAPVEQALSATLQVEQAAVEQAAAAADTTAMEAPAIESSPPGGAVPPGTVVASSPPQGAAPQGAVVTNNPPRGAAPSGQPAGGATGSPPGGAAPPGKPPAGDTTNTPLAGSAWQLLSMRAQGALLPGTSITLDFESASTLGGSAGCNSYSGAYTVNGAALRIGGISSTLMACGEGVDQQEQGYLALLQSSARFQQSSGQLVLFDSAGKELLRYSRR